MDIVQGIVGMFGQWWFYLLIVSIVGNIALMVYEKKNRSKLSHQTTNLLDDIKKILKATKSTLSSRTQRVFQEKEYSEKINELKNTIIQVEKKNEWVLGGFIESKSDDINRIRSILGEWMNKNPNYDNKENYLSDVLKINSILKKWL